MRRFRRYNERHKLGTLSTCIANLLDRHDLLASQSDSTHLKLTLTLTLSTPWMQGYLGTVVCKFGGDPVIFMREEAIFVTAQLCQYHVTFDLDLDLEHILDAGLPGDHRVQVWW